MIGGRDQQQNELLVKRYLKPGEFSLGGHNFHCVSAHLDSGGSVPSPHTITLFSRLWLVRFVSLIALRLSLKLISLF